jgi:MFS family permease
MGQGISLVGTWMQQVAVGWLVYRLTDSAFMLGVIGFCAQFPGLVMAPIAGALADRWNRYRMVVVAQSLAMIQASLLATLVLTGTVRVWHLVVLSLAAGLINGLDVPARQALLVRLVGGREDLPNAIALNSSMFNAARMVGPAIAGAMIAWRGEGPVFLLNAVSYVAVLGALAMLRLPKERGEPAGSVLSNIRKGVAYAFGFPPIRDLLFVLAVVSLVGVPYAVLLPVFAGEVLGGDAGTLGLLTSFAGLGALVGALRLASRDTVRGLGRLIVQAVALFGVALVGFAASRTLWLSSGLLALSGYGIMLTSASINTVLQTLVGDAMRGRVMSLFALCFFGVAPVGSLIGGALATRMGAPATVALGGLGCLVIAAWFAGRLAPLRELVLPVYERRGVIPAVARGLGNASEMRPKS